MHSLSTPITTHMCRHPPSSTDYHRCLTFPNLSLILGTSTFSQNKCHWFSHSGTLTPHPLPSPPPPHTTATHTTPNPEHQEQFSLEFSFLVKMLHNIFWHNNDYVILSGALFCCMPSSNCFAWLTEDQVSSIMWSSETVSQDAHTCKINFVLFL